MKYENRLNESFWEVALTNDRDAFLKDKRGKRYQEYQLTGKPVRLNQRPVRTKRTPELYENVALKAKLRQLRLGVVAA